MAASVSRQERTVSALLLAGLAVFCVWVLAGGRIQPAAEKRNSAPALPTGWAFSAPWEIYPNGRLYEKINGREPLFQEYGVVRLECAEASKGGQTFDVYLYRMNDPAGAVGVYLAHAAGEAKELDLGSMAESSGGRLRAVQGTTYLELLAQDKAFNESLALDLARGVMGSGLKDQGRGMIDVFPKRGRVKGTLAFNQESAFGLESLAKTVSAQYREGDVEFTFLVRRTSGGDGQKVLEKVRDEIKEFEGKILDFRPGKLAAEFSGKTLLFVADGPAVYGIYGEGPAARLGELLAKMKDRPDGR